MKNEWAEEKIVRYKQLKNGYTNTSYYLKTKKEEYFYQIFLYDKHNHKIKYELLQDFNFVPKTFYSSKSELISQFVKNETLEINNDTLKTMAKILKSIHTSEKKFPKNNIAKRIKYYYSLVKNKNDLPEEMHTHKKIVLKLLKNLKKDTPCHNDPWSENFIWNHKKLYLIDWEYATMNNKHFDLAYIITSSYFSKYQEKIFLENYGSYSVQELDTSKIIVFYITLLWIFKQETIPYPYKTLLKEMNKLIKLHN